MALKMVAAVVALLIMAAVPAWGGTPADPEVTDPCGAPAPGEEPVAPWIDFCGVAFSAPGEGADLSVTLLMGGAMAPRLPSFHTVAWQQSGCGMSVVQEDIGTEGELARTLYIQCDAASIVPCDPEILGDLGFTCFAWDKAVAVPISGVEAGSVLRLDIDRDDVPAHLRDLFAAGARVSRPYAFSGFSAGGQGVGGDGNCSPTKCTSRVGDYTLEGRGYTIGA